MKDKIEALEMEIEKVEALIRPKVKVAEAADELIYRANERRAHTGKYEAPKMSVQVFTSDNTIAEMQISAEVISRDARTEIEKQRFTVEQAKEKLAKIKEILES